MMENRRVFYILALTVILTFAGGLVSRTAFCADPKYPTKPVKVMVPYGAGGATDIAARVLAGVIPDFLGQPMVVIDKPGATGGICFDYVKKSKPDGYTMMMTSSGANLVYPSMNANLPYKYDDITFVARIQVQPDLVLVSVKSPWKKFEDLAQALKNNPGKYKYSTAGVGTSSHLGGSVLLKNIGLPLDGAIGVHYDSDANAFLALHQGEVDFFQAHLVTAIGGIDGGLARALVVTTPERIEQYKDVPSCYELGHPGMEYQGFKGMGGPPGLPDYVVNTWAEAIKKATKTKAWLKIGKHLGDVPGYLGPKDYANFMHTQFKKYRVLVTELGLLVK
jgi:tripartite-type tricarboxylate transporter receptor subunit TctC